MGNCCSIFLGAFTIAKAATTQARSKLTTLWERTRAWCFTSSFQLFFAFANDNHYRLSTETCISHAYFRGGVSRKEPLGKGSNRTDMK